MLSACLLHKINQKASRQKLYAYRSLPQNQGYLGQSEHVVSTFVIDPRRLAIRPKLAGNLIEQHYNLQIRSHALLLVPCTAMSTCDADVTGIMSISTVCRSMRERDDIANNKEWHLDRVSLVRTYPPCTLRARRLRFMQ